MALEYEYYDNFSWPYEDALLWMNKSHKNVIEHRSPGVIALGVHQHDVVTLGRHAPTSQILAREALSKRGVDIVRIERGGGATAHGPGQIVIYPIIPIANAKGVKSLTQAIEKALISLLNLQGLDAHTRANAPGVYVNDKKIGQLGFRVIKGIVTHGLSLNVTNDLSLFSLISACGALENEATSLMQLKSQEVWDIEHLGVTLRQNLVEELARVE